MFYSQSKSKHTSLNFKISNKSIASSMHLFLSITLLKKKQIDKKFANLDLDLDLNIGNNKKYKIKSIKNSIVYTKNVQSQLLDLYYLIS